MFIIISGYFLTMCSFESEMIKNDVNNCLARNAVNNYFCLIVFIECERCIEPSKRNW